MNRIRYGNSVISYTVIKTKRRKTSEIIVNEKGIEIRTPLTKKDSEIRQLVDDKKQWIFKKKLEFSDKKRKRTKTKSVSELYVHNRIKKLATKIEVKPSKVVIKKLKGRWGSSTKYGVINLNSALLEAPLRVIDYVIVHELCHLKIKEHSHRYWNMVHKYMPQYNYGKQWLEIHGMTIL